MRGKGIFQANLVYVIVANIVRFILYISFATLAFTFETLATMCKAIKGACERK